MIISEADQGSAEWFTLRMGIPTASEFHRIIQPGGEPRFKKNGEPYKTSAGELSEGRWAYAYELAIERLLKESKMTIDGLQWVERGKMLEADAVELYEAIYGPTAKCGFLMPDTKIWGCSPDRLLCDDVGGLEIKCPSGPKHLAYFIDGPGTNYKCQVQGSLLISGFDHWDFLSYHPQLPEVLIRFERDQPFIDKMEAGLRQFLTEIDEVCAKVKEAGFVPTPEHIMTPVDRMAADLDPDYGGPSDMNAALDIIEKQQWGG